MRINCVNRWHELTGTCVTVNGGYVEISYGDTFDRLMPDEAAEFVQWLAIAVEQVSQKAALWDPQTRTYRQSVAK